MYLIPLKTFKVKLSVVIPKTRPPPSALMRPHTRSITTGLENMVRSLRPSPSYLTSPLVGRSSEGVIPGYEEKRGKNTLEEWNNNKPHLHPPGGGGGGGCCRAHPPEFTRFLPPTPNPIHPSPLAPRPCFWRCLQRRRPPQRPEELLFGSQGWLPVSDVLHSLISWQELSD